MDLLKYIDTETGKNYPRIGGHKVWHKFSSNSRDEAGHFCETCLLYITADQIKKAEQELWEMRERRNVEWAWPQPLYRALEQIGESVVCEDLVPKFMQDVPMREIDSEYTDYAGVLLRGFWLETKNGFRRIWAAGITEPELKLYMSDRGFYKWFFMFNDIDSEWCQKAYTVLSRERANRPRQPMKKVRYG